MNISKIIDFIYDARTPSTASRSVIIIVYFSSLAPYAQVLRSHTRFWYFIFYFSHQVTHGHIDNNIRFLFPEHFQNKTERCVDEYCFDRIVCQKFETFINRVTRIVVGGGRFTPKYRRRKNV